jgi:hypothetical protein
MPEVVREDPASPEKTRTKAPQARGGSQYLRKFPLIKKNIVLSKPKSPSYITRL